MNYLNNKCIFGIRKIHGITGSVMIGLSLVASPVFADDVSNNNGDMLNSNDRTEVVSKSTDDIDSNVSKNINKVNNYNPKWDEINSDGEVVRDLNKYSDKEFYKRYTEFNSLYDSEGNRVENSGSIDDNDHHNDVVETSKPINEHEFTFKTVWDDGTTDVKSGVSNEHSGSLIGSYSGTESVDNLYVTIKIPKGYGVDNSSISEKLGELSDGSGVYELSKFNGGSQFEFKVRPQGDNIESKHNGDVDKIEYKVYHSKLKLTSTNLSNLSDSKLLYSGELNYTYSNLKQAGYELTDKYETVVKNNVSKDDAYRDVNLGYYNKNNNSTVERFKHIEIKTGLNNDAYTANYTIGSIIYTKYDHFEKINHDDETITVSGIPDGLEPLVDSVNLGKGSYKMKMVDFLNQPHGSTTLSLKYTDEFFKSTFGRDVKIRPEYKLERINKDGRVFVQIVKDSYDFTLSSKGVNEDGRFEHNVLNASNDFSKSINSKYEPSETVTLANDDYKNIKMMSNFKYVGEGDTSKTLVYSLDGADIHFDKIHNVDADIYSYDGSKWSYTGVGSINGSVDLPKNTKKVALSYKALSGDSRRPIFDTSLDDMKAFNSNTTLGNMIVNMFVQAFDEPDAVTHLSNDDIATSEKLMVDRTLILKKEDWTYHFNTVHSENTLSKNNDYNSFNAALTWNTNGPSDSKDHPDFKDIYYFARVDKELMKFNPVFNNVDLVSRKTLSDGNEFYLFKKSKFNNNYGDSSTNIGVHFDFDGVSSVNNKIVFGKIDKYSNGTNLIDGLHLDSNKLILGSDEIELTGDLKNYNVETSVMNFNFESLRESFSKLDLVSINGHVDKSTGKTVRPYQLIGSINNASTEDRILKNVVMTIPKAKDGTILNLSEHLVSNDDVKYYYELNGDGNFVSASNNVDLKTVTKVKMEYVEPIHVTSEKPWVWKLPLTLDERSTSDKKASGYLEFENADGSKQVTNSVDLAVDYSNILKNDGSLDFSYYVMGYGVDNKLYDNPLARFEMNKSFDFSNVKLVEDYNDIKVGVYHYDTLRTNGVQLPPGMLIQHLMTGTDGLVKFNPDEAFGNAVQNGGWGGYSRVKLAKTASDEFNNVNYILKYVLKRDKDGHLSKLSKDDVFRISDGWTIIPVYEIVSKPEFRGFVYKKGVDSSDDKVRRSALFDLEVDHQSGRIKPLYVDKVGDLDFGKSITKSHREIDPRVEIDENERFRRVRTYTYTYHKLNDIDGFKDDGTRTVTNAAFDSENYYLNNGLFFYDEHIDERIEWKTKTLTVNYVDADTSKILNTYTVQRLKDEKIGDFDKSYTDYSYVRSDFTESDLMGDSDRAINMYFSRNKAILRTETYVDDVLVNTVDKTVDTFSSIPNDKPFNTIEYNGKLASYDSTEVENDAKLVGDKDSVTTIKHHYRTISDITSPTVNMIFKDGDTVLGSAIIKSNKSGDKLTWELVDSNASDSFIDGILNRSVYKPADGQDWKPNGQFRTGEVTTTPDKLLYNVEFNVVKKEGRLTISYVDSKTGEKIISDEVYNPVVIGTEYNDIKPGLKLPSKEENVHQNGKLMKRLEFYVKSKDNVVSPITIKEGDNNVVFKYDKIVKFIDIDVKYDKNIGDVPIVDIPEFNGGVVPNEAPIDEKPDYEGGVVPNEAPIAEKPDYEGGVVPNDAPIAEKPDYEGGVVPNDAPIAEKPDYEGGVVPNEAPIAEKPEYEGPMFIPTTSVIYDEYQLITNKDDLRQDVKGVTLPNTGIGDSSILSLLGGLSLTSILGISSRKRKND